MAGNLDELIAKLALTPAQEIGTEVCAHKEGRSSPLLLADPDVTVWSIHLEPGEATLLYKSNYWYNYLCVYGDEITVVPHPSTGGELQEPTKIICSTGASGLVSPGGIEVIVNTGKTPFRGIRIENKLMDKPRGYKIPEGAPKKTIKRNVKYDRLAAIMRHIPLEELPESIGTEFYCADDDIELWGMNLNPGDIGDLHYHRHVYYLVFICGDVSGVHPNPLSSHGAQYFEMVIDQGRGTVLPPANGSEIAENIGKKRYRAVQVMLKNFDPGPDSPFFRW